MNRNSITNIIAAFILFLVMSAVYFMFIKKSNDELHMEPEIVQLDEKRVKENWSEISTIPLDIRYATKNNFTKEVIYPCGRCFLQDEVAEALSQAQKKLQAQNLSLVLFDCYRPLAAQEKLWNIVPNPSYVTPPEKGSMHNKGLAVDVSIADATGKLVDMGTPYDYFGEKAHVDFYDLPNRVLKNRKILNDVMIEFGFKGIRTEWWHFSFQSLQASIENWQWDCIH